MRALDREPLQSNGGMRSMPFGELALLELRFRGARTKRGATVKPRTFTELLDAIPDRIPCPLTVNGLPCELGKDHKRPCSVSASAVAVRVAERMDRLRETAAELRAGTIHPAHAANRIARIADEISRR